MSQKISIRSKRLLRGILALLALCSAVRADVIVVDESNGAGSDFSDLPQAIAAASHNDLLLVRSGSYSGFTTAKGVRILGLESNVEVSGPCVIQNLHSSRKFVLSRLELTQVEIRNCAGHVALSQIDGYPRLSSVVVLDSADVRLSELYVVGREGVAQAVYIGASEVELVNSRVMAGLAPTKIGTTSAPLERLALSLMMPRESASLSVT